MERTQLLLVISLGAAVCAGCGSQAGDRVISAPPFTEEGGQPAISAPPPVPLPEPEQPYRILLPDRPGRRPPLVLYCHGSGETADSIETDPLKRAMIEGFLASGYVVAASDAHGKAWGNDASLADYRDLVATVRSRHSTGRTLILAQSMGAIPGLLLIARGMIPDVVGFVGIEPCVDLAAIWEGPLRPAVAEAYGATGEEFPAAAAANNPMAYPAWSYPVPMRLYASPEDTLVPKAQHADALAALLGVGVVECRGNHGDPSHFQAEDVLSFVRSYLGP